ncbi:MAG: DNA-binding response regulator [Gammaproteobacteria bacterium CG11_big_fil_rev_8_21_14_0_20_46_22]|nr:MAG: DNA-binding response regulator [Gammaproteobacteria bacterium CG12_big_fil_rev_8_21_14_0_65_46_12]PIR11117.1 MAG: DNA-binding response regulator [Gammaproteobacteria bacterium CG11_big_fil_rev_8_21_14_0_20_46_22]
MLTKILIVDDDLDICELLSQFLEKYSYDVHVAHDGEQMYEVLKSFTPDLMILDMMLPGDDGLTLCQQLRQHYHFPILILSAAGEDTDRIVGLEVGADDYISKPFNPRELLARIKAIMRRSQAHHTNEASRSTATTPSDPPHERFNFDGWVLDIDMHELYSPQKQATPLSSGEFALLHAFVTHPQKVLTRDQLMEFTKDRDASPYDRSIDMQVSRLRQKIENDPKQPRLIKTIRGGGYLFTPKVEKHG